jgi:hypothetical protein
MHPSTSIPLRYTEPRGRSLSACVRGALGSRACATPIVPTFQIFSYEHDPVQHASLYGIDVVMMFAVCLTQVCAQDPVPDPCSVKCWLRNVQ